ncbi:MAG: gluconate 2-dehydrogenase subunit 3 family protein [Caulobacteraceae bacterium]
MSERFPSYDVLDKRYGPSWNEPTRRAIEARLAPPPGPRFFSKAEWATLEAVCDRIIPQPSGRPKVPLPDYVDQKLCENRLDGYRYADLPPQGEAWRKGLAGLEAAARQVHDAPFDQLTGEQQDSLLRRMQHGDLKGAAWRGMACKAFFARRLIPDITHAYYAHPTAWSEIGFGGPASPRGYVRLKLNRRDPWEAAEAGDTEQTRKANARVG